MAGAPFEAVAGFETRETFSIARRLIALERARNDAAAAVERIFVSGERPFSDEAYRALKTSLRTNHPPSAVAGTQPAAFMRYAEAATEVDAARKTLQSVLEGELLKARKALLDSSAHYLSRYVIFASPMVRFVLAKAIGGEIRTRDRDARKAEQTLLMYLQRIATKNDTFSEFGPSTWGRVTRQEEPLQTNPVPGVQARESYLERWTAHAIAAAVNEDLDASGLQGLHLRVPALDPYASETLAADVERWPDSEPRRKWLPPLQKLSGLPLKFREAKEPDER